MARTPNDIQDLISGLGKKPTGKVTAPRRRALEPEQRKYLVGALLVMILGLGYTIYESVTPKATSGAPEEEPEPHPDERKVATQNFIPGSPNFGSAGGGGAGSGGAVPARFRSNYANGLRPVSFLAELVPAPTFYPVAAVSLPKPGQKTVIYCLLYSILDPFTEQNWKNAGMFKDEGRVISPFLRTITIASQESLDNLNDWHIESIAFSIPKSQAAFDSEEDYIK